VTGVQTCAIPIFRNDVIHFNLSGYKQIEFFKWLGVAGLSKDRIIPSIILKSPKRIVASFLRAYFEGDGGWIEDLIVATSSSHNLIRQIQIVLLNFGIRSQTYPIKESSQWRLSIGSFAIDNFMVEIGFLTDEKNAKYNTDSVRNPNVDVIPNIGFFIKNETGKYRYSRNGCYKFGEQQIRIPLNYYMHPNWSYRHTNLYLEGTGGLNLKRYFPDIYKKVSAICKLNYYWTTPKRMERHDTPKRVYDVSLPETHSFFSNGFVNHNTTLARIIAHYINCDHFDETTCLPCGKCSYCKDVERNYYGGVDEINFSNDRGIDTIRAVIDSTAYASQFNAHVFICDEIQCLTGLAQNALLKILEEPPEGVVFLLLTTDPHRLLPTIINRCCPLTVARVETDEMAKYLLKICKLEDRDYFTPKKLANDPDAAKLEYEKAYAIFKNIAMFSNGLVRQALATLEAVLSMIEGGQKFDPQDVEVIRKIVGKFIDNPETETSIATYLMSGVYSGRYSLSLSYALKLIQTAQSNTCKQTFERVLDTHLQALYYLVDPHRRIGNLTDPFYTAIYASMREAANTPGGLQVTHQSAAEIVQILMSLVSDMGTYLHDERRLVVAATLKMLDAVNKYRHLAYTKQSLFHKVICPDLLVAKEG
jgi:DNA polymerase III delta prime subunit